MAIYKLIRIEADKTEKMVELSSRQMDLLYLGLKEVQDDITDMDSPYYDKEDDEELAGLFTALYEVTE